ncbi:MAG: HAMP domain-containing sensor histidine kinase [Sulfuricurvum sp.]|nr:HAMP domain-containing sensor histidine kinase [Sulfuricurvum sp.]
MKKIIVFCMVSIGVLWSQEVMVLRDKVEIDFWLLVAVIAVFFIGGLTYKYIRLDQIVRQRTAELETFNHKLQDEISKAVEKNRTQENILMQQAKMAEIGSMVESIAHQWRQPLNILGLSMTRLSINMSLGNNNDMSKVIEIVEQQIEYMSQTIDDFRNFFKQDRTQTKVNVYHLIGEVEALLGPLLASKKIEFIKNIDPSIEILVYHNELKQVLLNIVNNAREAIEHNKSKIREITITCVSDKYHCTISIQDSGGGVPHHIVDKIFDPYFTTKFESQGTGIGLYMAKMIIEKHCFGKLSIYNTKEGACFEIWLRQSGGINGEERRAV